MHGAGRRSCESCVLMPQGGYACLQLHLAFLPCFNNFRSKCTDSSLLSLPLPPLQMTYAELLWLDAQGMYVRCETAGAEGSRVLRVPFYRTVLDERDVRSVITMAAQVGGAGW